MFLLRASMDKFYSSEAVDRQKLEGTAAILTIAYHNIAAEYEFMGRIEESIRYLNDGILFCQRIGTSPTLKNKMQATLDELILKKKVGIRMMI